MFKSFGDIYHLKEKTTIDEILDCIKKTFADTKYYETIKNISSHNVFLEDEQYAIMWHYPEKSEPFFDFSFFDDSEENTHILRIAFNPKLQDNKNGKTHALYYMEKGMNKNISFYDKFFSFVCEFVPNSYKKTEIRTNINLYQMRQTLETLVNNIYSINEGKNQIIDCFKNNNFDNIDKIKKQYERKLQYEPKQIFFYQNNQGNYIINEKDIKRLATELWFFNYDFIKIPYKNGHEIFPAIGTKIQSLQWSDEIFDDFEKIKEFLIEVSIFYSNSIAIESKADIFFPQLLKKQDDNSIVVDKRVNFKLKEMGISNILNQNELLCKENTKLTNENDLLKNELQDLQKELSDAKEKIEQIPLANENSFNTTIAELNHELSEEKKANDKLHDDNKQLQNRIQDLEEKLKEKNNLKNKDGYILQIPCSESELFHNEIKDYLYKLLYDAIDIAKKNLPTNKDNNNVRKTDVLSSLIKVRNFNWDSTETCKKLQRIDRILVDSKNGADIDKLKKEGFTIESENKHNVCSFYKRYNITFSSTPSDNNVANNQIKEIQERLFLL